MFDTLFGAEMPLAVRFFLAFLIVLGLIGATAWAVRRFGAGRLGANTRGRQPRLAVIDHASVDGRRRLILVRRDNVEHLLMVGGPTDVVVEQNIVRAVAAPRDVPAVRGPAGIESLPRAIPLPESTSNGNGGGAWPLQPEPLGGVRPSPRLEPLVDEPRAYQAPFQPMAEPPPRPPRDTLAALADELSTRPAPPRTRPAPAARPQLDELSQALRQEIRQEPRYQETRHQETRQETRQETQAENRSDSRYEFQDEADGEPEARIEPRLEPRAEPRSEPRSEPRAEPRSEPKIEPRAEARTEPRPEPRKPFVPPAAAPIAPAPASAAAASEADQSLADMAQRLEAALRKPNAATAATSPSRTAPPPEPAAPSVAVPPPPPRPARMSEPRSSEPRSSEPRSSEPRPSRPDTPARADTKPNQSKTALYDSLEQEMANLLGRPPKT